MKSKYICFFDLETSGLDPHKHEIIQVAAIRTNHQFHVLDTYEQKVQFDVDSASSQALAINNYSEEAWKEAVPLKQALVKMQALMSLAVPAGHNITGFDLPFMREAWRSYWHLQPSRMDYHALDTMHLAWPLLFQGKVKDVKLATLAKYFDIEQKKAHDALDDVTTTMAVAQRLIACTDPS